MLGIRLNDGNGERLVQVPQSITVKDLKSRLGLVKGEIVFSGGKKPKDDDLIPHAGKLEIKARIVGGKFSNGPSVTTGKKEVKPLQEEQEVGTSNPPATGEDIDEENCILLKGLQKQEIKLPKVPTYQDLKRWLVEQKYIQSEKSIKFLGKGGKFPGDDELIPQNGVVNLRVIKTEVGYTQQVYKDHVEEIKARISLARKTLKSIQNRLIDSQSAIVEKRRIQDEMEDAVSYLNSKSHGELIEEAQEMLELSKQ